MHGNAEFYPCYFLPHYRYSGDFSRLLWKSKLHYCAYERPLLDAIMTQINRSHFLKLRCLKNQFNIILPFTSRSSRCALSFRISDRTAVCLSCPRFFYFGNRTGFEFLGYASFLYSCFILSI